MKTMKVSLIGLFYQGKDDEFLKVLARYNRRNQQDQPRKVKMLVDLDEQDRFGCSILNLLIRVQKEDLALALWRAGADELKKDKDGMIPLIQAIQKGQEKLVMAMVERMAEKETGKLYLNTCYREYQNYSALHAAVNFGSLALVEAMLKAGANPLVRGDLGPTPLFVAAINGFEDKVRLLLKFLPEEPDENLLNSAAFMAGGGVIRAMIQNAMFYPSLRKG